MQTLDRSMTKSVLFALFYECTPLLVGNSRTPSPKYIQGIEREDGSNLSYIVSFTDGSKAYVRFKSYNETRVTLL